MHSRNCSIANKLKLLQKSKFLPRKVCESFYQKVILPSITYAMSVWGGLNQTELFSALERQHCRAARIIFGLPSDMPSVQVLDTVKWYTLSHLYKSSLIKLIFNGYNNKLSHALGDQLTNRNCRSATRLKHGIIAPSFGSKYMQNSIAYRGAVLWNALGRSDDRSLTV